MGYRAIQRLKERPRSIQAMPRGGLNMGIRDLVEVTHTKRWASRCAEMERTAGSKGLV